MKILVLTVGGDDMPMVQSIEENKPDHIYFICSSGPRTSRVMIEGEGLVCGGKKGEPHTRPNILAQTGFPKEKVTTRETDPDEPYEAYDVAREIIAGYQGYQVYADYTCGTKSMAAGLFLAASEFEYCQPILVKGPRADLIKVTGDRSRVVPINRNSAMISRYKKTFEELLEKQDYGGARDIVRTISRIGVDDQDGEFLDRANLTMRAFDLWDRFEYASAWEELDYFCGLYKKPSRMMIQLKIIADRIAGIVHWLKNEDSLAVGSSDRKKTEPKTPYTVNQPLKEAPLPVYDLIRNAERRARMERYDDAVARLYRATELYAQFTLRRRGIHTANLTEDTLAVLSAEHRERLEKKRNADGKLAIGLFESYELLGSLGEPVGQIWEANKARINHVIQYRNLSWLAHGFEPVDKKNYEQFRDVLLDFIQQCEEADPNYRKSGDKLGNYPDLPNDISIMQ